MSMAKAQNEASFEEVCDLLQLGHRQSGHTPEQTLNRLFRKHLAGHKPDIASNPPWLSSANTLVTTEIWSKSSLRQLAPRAESREPRHQEFPVVIVRYQGRDCLIDGGSRIHAWFQAGDIGRHSAYIISVSVAEMG